MAENPRPQPRCCTTGLEGWAACPREWLCPGAAPVFRKAYLKLREATSGTRRLSWERGTGQTELPVEVNGVRGSCEAWDVRFDLLEAARIEYLAYLYQRSREWYRRAGGVDPDMRA